MGAPPSFSPAQPGTQPKDLVDTRWVLAWKEVEGEKTVKSRLETTGYQDPDLRMGNVDIAGCVIRRYSHLRAISLGALMKWLLRSLDIKNAFLQADGFDRVVYLRAPSERHPKDTRRVRQIQAAAYGLNDAPMAARRPLRE